MQQSGNGTIRKNFSPPNPGNNPPFIIISRIIRTDRYLVIFIKRPYSFCLAHDKGTRSPLQIYISAYL